MATQGRTIFLPAMAWRWGTKPRRANLQPSVRRESTPFEGLGRTKKDALAYRYAMAPLGTTWGTTWKYLICLNSGISFYIKL
jgi:hypothetical protein